MKTSAQIYQRQQEFLDRYNPNRSVDIALTSGLKAATQHNDLYSPDVNRAPIRAFLKNNLQCVGMKYQTKQELPIFLDDIVFLKEQMNKQFKGLLDNDGGRYDQGFRISHAQKSISVYLKHIWCMGLIETPPFCPIDEKILKNVNYHDLRWCHVNCMDLYNKHVEAIIEGKNANPLYDEDPIAVWELFEF